MIWAPFTKGSGALYGLELAKDSCNIILRYQTIIMNMRLINGHPYVPTISKPKLKKNNKLEVPIPNKDTTHLAPSNNLL